MLHQRRRERDPDGGTDATLRVADAATLTSAEIQRLESALSPDPMVSLSFDFPSGGQVETHAHGYGQLMFCNAGVMIVGTDSGSWVIPPQRAIWLPAGTPHGVRLRSAVKMQNMLISGALQSRFPDHCALIAVSGLLREVVLRLERPDRAEKNQERTWRLMSVLLDELDFMNGGAVSLPAARDRRIARVCEGLFADPADNRTLREWAVVAGASARTLSRLFLKDLGITFEEWRRQLRLQEAIYRLAQSQPVGAVAFDLGYESTTGFIEMFRRALGCTPAQYFHRDADR